MRPGIQLPRRRSYGLSWFHISFPSRFCSLPSGLLEQGQYIIEAEGFLTGKLTPETYALLDYPQVFRPPKFRSELAAFPFYAFSQLGVEILVPISVKATTPEDYTAMLATGENVRVVASKAQARPIVHSVNSSQGCLNKVCLALEIELSNENYYLAWALVTFEGYS